MWLQFWDVVVILIYPNDKIESRNVKNLKVYYTSAERIKKSIHSSSSMTCHSLKISCNIRKRNNKTRTICPKSLRVIYFGTGRPNLSIAILMHDVFKLFLKVKLHPDTVVCPRSWNKCKKYMSDQTHLYAYYPFFTH